MNYACWLTGAWCYDYDMGWCTLQGGVIVAITSGQTTANARLYDPNTAWTATPPILGANAYGRWALCR